MVNTDFSKNFSLETGCEVYIRYEGEGNFTWWENLIPNGVLNEDAAKALALNPINDIRSVDGKLQMEFDFNFNAGCWKDQTRSDRCTAPGGCQGYISGEFQFWLDIDFMLPDSGPPGSSPEEDKEWKDAKEKFKSCVDNWNLDMSDTMCILAHQKYLEAVLGRKDGAANDKFIAMLLADWEAMHDEPVTDGGESPPGSPMSGAGVPNGVYAAIHTIIDEIGARNLWDFVTLCSCDKLSLSMQDKFGKQVQDDIDRIYAAEWADIINYYVRSFWDAAQTGDTDYITNIASYDEILVLTAEARRLGRS